MTAEDKERRFRHAEIAEKWHEYAEEAIKAVTRVASKDDQYLNPTWVVGVIQKLDNRARYLELRVKELDIGFSELLEEEE